MEFFVLGSLEARDDESALPLVAPMQRALLGHLLLAAGNPVPIDELTDRLWQSKRPRRPRNAIQLLVLRLRRVLADFGCPARIESTPGAYRLDLRGASVDWLRFEDLVEQADAEHDRGNVDSERVLLDDALKLWRGPVLGDFSAGWYSSPEASRLTAMRLTTVERLAAADISCNLPDHAISLLRGSLGDHPAREHLRYLLVLALYSGGRRAEALASYAEAYRYLADELGLEPGLKLRQLHESILYERELAEPDATDQPEPDAPRRQLCPAVLPTRVAGFVGRKRQLGRIRARMLSDARSGTAICGISGMAGVGKSALALQVAHRMRKEFPDGQLYFDFEGDPSMGPGEVLADFLRLLGLDDAEIPAGLDARVGLFRACTSARRLLILLDDVTDAAQIRPLLPGDGHSAVVVTSRFTLLDLDGACWFTLGVLSSVDSLALLASLTGEHRLGAAPADAARITEYCGGLPLALRVVGAKLSTRPTWPIDRMADSLADGRTRLDRLDLGDLSVCAAIGSSYRQCTVEQRNTLKHISLFDQPGFSTGAVAASLGTDLRTGADLVEQLVDIHLVQLVTDDTGVAHYRLHSLVKLFARRQAEWDGRAEVARAADRQRPRVVRPGWSEEDESPGGAAADRQVRPPARASTT